MKGKKFLFILLKLSFVFSSIKFMRDAFYKWDGFSYHMNFWRFLPELSFAFILWSLNSLIFALLLYMVLYPLYKIISSNVFKRGFEKIFYGLNSLIAPLVLLFAILFIIAIPLSIFRVSNNKTGHLQDPPDKAEKKLPNIILVVMDAMSAEDMQLYGYNRHTTPFINEWAKNTFVFNRVYSTSNWTTPSTMSIMTGQRPWTHRAWYIAEHISLRYGLI